MVRYKSSENSNHDLISPNMFRKSHLHLVNFLQQYFETEFKVACNASLVFALRHFSQLFCSVILINNHAGCYTQNKYSCSKNHQKVALASRPSNPPGREQINDQTISRNSRFFDLVLNFIYSPPIMPCVSV